MKKLKFSIMLVFISLFVSACGVNYFIPPRDLIRIIIDGEYQHFAEPPVIMNGRTLLPLRNVLVALGVPNDNEHIIWNETENSVTVKFNDITIQLAINNEIAKVNGKEISLDQPATIINSRTYLPTRFVAEALNKAITWDEEDYAVYINSKKEYDEIEKIWTKVAQSYHDIKDFDIRLHYYINTFSRFIYYNAQLKKTDDKQMEQMLPKVLNGIVYIMGDILNDVIYIKDPRHGTFYQKAHALYSKPKDDDDWVKYTYLERGIKGLENATNSLNETDISSRPSLDKIYNLLDKISYAGFVKNYTLSNNDTIVIQGSALPKNMLSTLLYLYPTGFYHYREMAQDKSEVKIREMTYETQIFIDAKNYRIKNIILTPRFTFYPNSFYNPEDKSYIKGAGYISMYGRFNYYFNYNSGFRMEKPPIDVMEK